MPHSVKGATLLIVDDTPKNIQVLGKILSTEGYNIHVAQNGLQAIERAKKVIPDLILLDVMMPGLDGFETCEQLKRIPSLQEIPIIFLTAKTESDDVVKGFDLGAVDYVTKPFHAPELLARVHTHLQLRYEIEARKKREQQIQEELEEARHIQQNIVPLQLPQLPNAQLVCKFAPMARIGGDFYNIFNLGNGKYVIMIADVSGHGIPAALVASLISGAFTNNAGTENSTEMVVHAINAYLSDLLPPRFFSTMFYGIYDSQNHLFQYTSAGHPDGLVIRTKTNDFYSLSTGGMVLGVVKNEMAQYKEKTFQLESGDKLLLYTDGIYEVTNAHEERLGKKGLNDFLQNHASLPISTLVDELYHYGLQFSGKDRYNDDVTLVGLEVLQ